jgi:hypothetical protein
MLAVTPSAAFLIPDCSTYFPISVRILLSNPALQVVPLRNCRIQRLFGLGRLLEFGRHDEK